ncbi:hypothetical protein LN650_19115 [Klebsiella pneumoniae subsp. pneumoniae]|nr:hypothetical protein [Klebsiella pneumoniae subsp. pneumoniae]
MAVSSRCQYAGDPATKPDPATTEVGAYSIVGYCYQYQLNRDIRLNAG